MNDLSLALRRLRRSPRFAVTAALTLALGVGGVAGIFALVDSVLLRPLPYPEPDRLVMVTHSAPGLGLAEAGHSFGTYHHYRDNSRALQDLAVYNENVVDLSDGAEPERVRVAIVTPNLFSTLGVAPALGRSFVAEDGLPRAPAVVIIGHDLWVRRYGADQGIIGRTVELNRAPRQVVGVMPAGFGFPRRETEVWYARGYEAAGANLSNLYLAGIARLAPGASAESAARELNDLIPRLADAYPDVTPSLLEEAGLFARVESLKRAMLGELSRVLWLVLAAMVLVLAIAAANVANLFLVRAEERRVEIALRAALGAKGGERIRTFLLEGLVLGALGGALALPLAATLVGGVLALGPTDLPRMHEVAFRERHVLLALGVSLFLGAFLSVMAVLRGVARGEGMAGLRVDPRAAADTAQRRAMRLLTVGQIAIGFTLLVGSALLLQSFQRLRAVEPGFDAENVLTLEIALPRGPYPPGEAQIGFWRTLLERVEALPGVDAAGAAASLPLASSYLEDFLWEPVSVERGTVPGEVTPSVAFVSVTPGYFEALRIPILSGDAPSSWSSTEHAAVVSSAFARRFLAGRDPRGVRLRPMRTWMDVPWHTVTGVVGDVRAEDLTADPTPVVYVPVSAQLAEPAFWPSHMSLAVRTDVPPLSVAASVRSIVRDLDGKLPIAQLRTMKDIVARAKAPDRFLLLALTLAAVVALFLAAVGTYGLVAYAVSRRTQELGVRIALGASGARVRRLVLRQGAALAVAGVAVGMAVTLAAAEILRGVLYEVDAANPLTLVTASLFLVAIVLLAVDVPARRAARVDPMEALRYE